MNWRTVLEAFKARTFWRNSLHAALAVNQSPEMTGWSFESSILHNPAILANLQWYPCSSWLDLSCIAMGTSLHDIWQTIRPELQQCIADMFWLPPLLGDKVRLQRAIIWTTGTQTNEELISIFNRLPQTLLNSHSLSCVLLSAKLATKPGDQPAAYATPTSGQLRLSFCPTRCRRRPPSPQRQECRTSHTSHPVT